MSIMLIIGNGFDLQCGLESRFSDFFDNYEKSLIERYLEKGIITDARGISVWSLLLYNSYYRSDIRVPDYERQGIGFNLISFSEVYKSVIKFSSSTTNWMDVESFVSCVLKNAYDVLLNIFNRAFVECRSGSHGICQYDGINDLIHAKRYLTEYTFIDSLDSFLLKELQLFEDRFAKYLKGVLKSNHAYAVKSDIIVSKILGRRRGLVLNFNYTKLGKTDCLNEINVHGSLETHPIIGIDFSNCKDHVLPFTKTVRKLSNPSNKVVLSAAINEIVIYGHSLGEQDYSYFQSIFDYLDLYGGSTKVTFIYSDNYISADNETELSMKLEKHKMEMTNKFASLLTSYGKTMSNKANGENLLHKLLLEGRVEVRKKNFISLTDDTAEMHEKNN